MIKKLTMIMLLASTLLLSGCTVKVCYKEFCVIVINSNVPIDSTMGTLVGDAKAGIISSADFSLNMEANNGEVSTYSNLMSLPLYPMTVEAKYSNGVSKYFISELLFNNNSAQVFDPIKLDDWIKKVNSQDPNIEIIIRLPQTNISPINDTMSVGDGNYGISINGENILTTNTNSTTY